MCISAVHQVDPTERTEFVVSAERPVIALATLVVEVDVVAEPRP